MDTEKLDSHLDRFVSEEHFYLELYYKELRFFWASIGVILAATIAGFMRVDSRVDYLPLFIGPLMIWLISEALHDSLYRTYRRYLETIASRAKIEALMGLCDESILEMPYWGKEPILSNRHIKSRQAATSSESFVENNSKGGLYRKHGSLIKMISKLAIFLAISLAVGFMTFGVGKKQGAASLQESKAPVYLQSVWSV
jgi:hypothetical protein